VNEVETNMEKADKIINKNLSWLENKRSPVMPVLHEIQQEFGWLPEKVLIRASRKLKIPLIELYGIASFYNEFRLNPLGENHIVVCTGTACHVRGAAAVLDELKRQLGIDEGEVTPDMKFSLDTAGCVGACAIAPVLTVNEEYYGGLTKKDISSFIEELKKG